MLKCKTAIFLLINVKMAKTVGIITFMSRKNSILGLSEAVIPEFYYIFYIYEHINLRAQLIKA